MISYWPYILNICFVKIQGIAIIMSNRYIEIRVHYFMGFCFYFYVPVSILLILGIPMMQ